MNCIYKMIPVIFLLLCISVVEVRTKELVRYTTVSQLKEDLRIFNEENEGNYRRTILKYFGSNISKKELDSLIIIGEPVVSLDDNIKFKLSLEDLKDSYMLNDIWDYCVYPNTNHDSIYHHIKLQKYYNDSSSISFRLYTPSKKHKYEMMIINQNERINRLPGDTSKRILASYIDLENKTDIEEIFYKNYSVPIDYITFSINFNLQYLPNCIIYKDIIYSIFSLDRKARKEGYDNYIHLPKDKWDECEISNYLSEPPAFKVK